MQTNVNDMVQGMTVTVTSLGMARKMERIPTERSISALLNICGDGKAETLITIKGDTIITGSTK